MSSNFFADDSETTPETTPEIAPEVLWTLSDYGNSLKYVPESMKTKEICELAVSNDGRALEYVPESMKTNELCRIAVRGKAPNLRSNDKRALEYVPQNLKPIIMGEFNLNA